MSRLHDGSISLRGISRLRAGDVTVSVQSTTRISQRPANTKPPHTSARHNSTNMSPIEAAIAAVHALEPGEKFSYTKIASQFGVNRTTLVRRCQGLQASRATEASTRRNLSPQQELELVRYIKGLTKRGLPPTREMIRNFSSEVAHQQLSESWVTRFINRHKIHVISSGPAP